jgi:dipeptidase E
MGEMTTPSHTGQIVAMGGGGFSMEPENVLLDRYILGLSGKARPKICFVGTATGDIQSYILNFYVAFSQLDCVPSHLPLFNPPTADLRSFVMEKDVIYVGGGNTKNLVALWKAWGLDAIFREAWEKGMVLSGVSAGSICWFEQGVTDSIPGLLTPLDCLGFLRGSNCPHYDGEPGRRPAYQRLRADDQISDGYAADDSVGLHYVGEQLVRIVSSRPNARAYRLEKTAAGVIETPLDPVFLGAPAAG